MYGGCAVTVKDRSWREASLPRAVTESYDKPSNIFGAAAMIPKNVERSVTAPLNIEATNISSI